MLVGAMNPCRCGWYGHPSGRCRCSQKDVEKYVSKISGPLLDRMDLQVSVPSVEFEAMRRREKAESSAAVRERVNAARDIQKKRFAGTPITCNAYMTAPMVGEFCRLDAAGEKLLKGAFDRLGSPPAATISCCASRAPSPTSTAARESRASTLPRPSSTATRTF